MKKIIFLCVFLIFGQIINAQYFKLNTNPENPTRQPDWKNEIGIILSKDSPIITIGGANNKKSTGKLSAGTIVFANKKTLEASWVGICGNTNHTPGWKPEGKIISQENYQTACEEMILVLSKLNKLQEGMDELLERPSSNLSLTEIKIMFEKTLKNKFPEKPENLSPWKGEKIIMPLGCVLAGGLIGGYGFPTETTTQIVTPGTKTSTGNSGTYLYGPQKIKESVERKFNWTGAAIGAGSGLILGYLLNEVIF